MVLLAHTIFPLFGLCHHEFIISVHYWCTTNSSSHSKSPASHFWKDKCEKNWGMLGVSMASQENVNRWAKYSQPHMLLHQKPKIQSERYWGEEKEIMLMLAKQKKTALAKSPQSFDTTKHRTTPVNKTLWSFMNLEFTAELLFCTVFLLFCPPTWPYLFVVIDHLDLLLYLNDCTIYKISKKDLYIRRNCLSLVLHFLLHVCFFSVNQQSMNTGAFLWAT